MADNKEAITFELTKEQSEALRALAGSRKVRLSGQIKGGKLEVDSICFAEEGAKFPGYDAFTAVNAPFKTKALV